ncbi:MAG TPA: transcription-repair coupling factor [Actinobacteria bacterium]|nr:transcription-repair coupling factor [Actinomycetota bacterium]
MTLNGLLPVFARDPQLADAIERAKGMADAHEVIGPRALSPMLMALLAESDYGNRTVLAVTATTREAEDLAGELRGFLSADAVVEFPAWETLPHERLSPTHDTVGRRLQVLRRLSHPDDRWSGSGEIKVVVAGVRALLQPIVTGLGDLEPVSVRAGESPGLEAVVEQLISIGYGRTDLVTRRGELAVRGGIVDVFVPTDDHPLRLEFFGDEVEEVRSFSVTDQRSLDLVERGLWAPPCREVLLTPEVRQRAKELAEQYPELIDILEPLSQGIHVEGMESLAPVLCGGMSTLLELLPHDALTVVCEPERVRRRAEDLLATSAEFLAAGWQAAATGGQAPLDVSAASYRTLTQMREQASDLGLAWWTFAPFGMDEFDPGEGVQSDAGPSGISAIAGFRGDVSAAMNLVGKRVRAGDRVVLITAGHGPAARLAEQLADRDVPARLVGALDAEPSARVATVVTGPLQFGVDAPIVGLLVLTETDLLGSQGVASRAPTKMPARRKRTIDPLQLSPGDYIVHEQHGVGQFIELAQRSVGGATREYVVVEYAASKRGQPPDRLYVPTDQLDQITRYVGGEAPSVHRLGGTDWSKAKTRARKAVREIAGELVRLYAIRQNSPGYSFGPDTPWQTELEDAFPFAETPDQLVTIDEVKADMEKSVPMDRIVCGDVGYGKTEIAVRAAFKAVQDGKQVAVLVPTTLLVRQHQQTFAARFAPFPIRVEALSRFQSPKESKQVLEGISDGTVDVVIATHRLLSPQTRFKDLGLVIVDEEQRFGVEHKEHLKALRANVDVLTMSATPIPRTLEMAVTGIREMSTIATPPEQRLPVLTYVGPFDNSQITAAIRRELLREGQVFFIHNRVESIERAARKINELVPEARVAVAHGQMGEHVLEKVIDDFWERRIDVLVCTTIVESGLDITNANTLIVDRADTFGVSQLHQLRGRVGRGRDRAYAYFFFPGEKTLSETAHERLATIAQHTDLGSGIAVAMKDLEIRGAGNLLGGEQSGHIADVGFDLYVRMVGEALAEVKGEVDTEPTEVLVELPVDAHIPEAYVPEERLRLEAYKAIASVSSEEDVEAAMAELKDRYGQFPAPVETLFEVARLRMLARKAGLAEIVVAGSRIRFSPVELPDSRTMRFTRLYPGTQLKPATRTALVPRPATAKVGGKPLINRELISWATELIKSVFID